VTNVISFGNTTDVKNSEAVYANAMLSVPFGMVHDLGYMYMANGGNNTIVKFDHSGRGTVFANTNMNGPRGLARDSSGNLYPANFGGGNTITKIDPSGNTSTFANSGMSSPHGEVFDAFCVLYTTSSGSDSIVKFDSAGSPTTFANMNMNGRTGVTIDSSGRVYATNFFGNTIARFDANGSNGAIFINANLTVPQGITFDSQGNLYVAKYNGNFVSKFDSNRNFPFNWATPTGPRYFAFAPEPATWFLGTIASAALAVFARNRKVARG